MPDFSSICWWFCHQSSWYPRASFIGWLVRQPATKPAIFTTCPTKNSMGFWSPTGNAGHGQYAPNNPCMATSENSFCRFNPACCAIIYREISESAIISATNHPKAIILSRVVTVNKIINLHIAQAFVRNSIFLQIRVYDKCDKCWYNSNICS